MTDGTVAGAELTRKDRLVAACEAALDRLRRKESAGESYDIFPELGETLFWLCALAEAIGRNDPLILGLTWARNRITHGVLVTAPVAWERGSALPRSLPMPLGVAPHRKWLLRGQIDLGPNDKPAPKQEGAYDREIATKPVIDTIARALELIS